MPKKKKDPAKTDAVLQGTEVVRQDTRSKGDADPDEMFRKANERNKDKDRAFGGKDI